MPSHKPMKTYQKKTRIQMNNSSKSVDAINALFAQNLTKRLKSRRKAKLKLKELPPRTEPYLTDESLNIEPNNTFDKILKGKVFNKVKVGRRVKVTSSESETSKSRAQISVSFHSPVMTRRRKKSSVIITEISDKSKEIKSKNSTLDQPVTSSLSIEKENKGVSISSLSYIKLPKITENEVMNNNAEESYQPIFSETFRERQTVHSSTPCVKTTAKKIVVDAISPITKSDSSNSSQLIEKSYDQIRKWDENFPNLEETPQKSLIPVGRRRKLSTVKDAEDWKLCCQPVVYLKSKDRISSKSRRSLKSGDYDLTPDFRGFSEEEQSNSSRESSHIQSWLNSMNLDYKERKRKQTLPTLKYDPRKGKKSRNNSLKTPVKIRETGKRSVPRRKSQRQENYSHGREKIKSARKSKESKPPRVSRNKRSLKEKPSLDPPKKVKTKIKQPSDEECLKRSARTLQKNQTKKLSITPLKRSTRTVQVSKKLRGSVTSPKRLRRSRRFERTVNSSSEISKTSFENSKNVQNESVTEKGTQRFITLRRREIPCLAKASTESNVVSTSKKSKTKKPLCINVTEDILSEKEVSYSHSSFDFSSESSLSKISYTTEELKQEKEVSLPKINTADELMTVDLRDFDTFMESYYVKETENEKDEPMCVPKEVPAFSVISLSDDSMFKDSIVNSKIVQVKPSAMKEEKVSPSETNLKEDVAEESCLQSEKSLDSSDNRTNKKVDLLTTPEKLNTPRTDLKTPKNSKIIILSNVRVGFNQAVADLNETVKSVQHDHSYCSPTSKMQLSTPPSVGKVEEVETSLWTNEKSHFSDIIESSFLPELPHFERKFKQKSIKLKPGKSYRRSLSLLKRSSVMVDVHDSALCDSDCTCLKCLFRPKFNRDVSRRKTLIVPVSRISLSNSVLERYARSSAPTYDTTPGYVRGEEEEDRVDNLDESVRNLSLDERRKSILHSQLTAVTAKEVVLRRCGQTQVLPFEECYPRSALKNCQKIGEGVYGEVFLYRNQDGGTSVMKVIPIESDLIVNGERQKRFDEILSEIVIAMELSELRNNKKNTTTGFSQVQRIRCTQGNYPDRLVDLWDLYDETKGSENDSPQMFTSNQIYVVLELANSGRDLESFVFNNAMQAFAVFKQTACALAVAENQLKFEHRDLHWGNVLISGVDRDKTLQFRLNGKEIEVETCGVEAAIIDFTLSRIEFDGVVIFNDLSLDDELFVAQGDYQFEIYRAMQKSNGNEWQHFEPYTNILWLHYLLDKAVTSALRYKNPRTKIHKEYLTKMNKFKDEILSYNSVVEFVLDNFA